MATHRVEIADEDVDAFWRTTQDDDPCWEVADPGVEQVVREQRKRGLSRRDRGDAELAALDAQLRGLIAQIAAHTIGRAAGDEALFAIRGVDVYRVTASAVSVHVRTPEEAAGRPMNCVAVRWRSGEKVTPA